MDEWNDEALLNRISELAAKYCNKAKDCDDDDPGIVVTLPWLHGLFQEFGLELIERHYRAATTTEIEGLRNENAALKLQLGELRKYFARAATKAETCPRCGGNNRSHGFVAGLAIHGNRPEYCPDPWHSPAPAPQKEEQ